MKEIKQTPCILADCPKRRFRISKCALHNLGNPTHIRLLINPEARSLAIEVCDPSEPRGHRVPSYVVQKGRSFEIYSSPLFDQLLYHTNWNEDRAYKMYASAQAGEHLLIFKFDDSFPSAGGMPVLSLAERNEVDDEIDIDSRSGV